MPTVEWKMSEVFIICFSLALADVGLADSRSRFGKCANPNYLSV